MYFIKINPFMTDAVSFLRPTVAVSPGFHSAATVHRFCFLSAALRNILLLFRGGLVNFSHVLLLRNTLDVSVTLAKPEK